MTQPPRTNLVILRAGNHSLHREWLAGAHRNFDIFVSYYGQEPDLHRNGADYYEMRPGPKWPCLGDLLAQHAALIEQYEAFWFPDDDLAANTETINRMFSIFHGFNLALAQPALTRDSFYSWDVLLQRPGYVLRYLLFVEIMAPIFTRASLRACLHTFTESRSGWGLDFVWPELLPPAHQQAIAVLDATPVRHTRPVGGELYRNHPDMKPCQEAEAVVQRYQAQVRKATAGYGFSHGVAEVKPGWVEQIRTSVQRWNALRRMRRRLQQT